MCYIIFIREIGRLRTELLEYDILRQKICSFDSLECFIIKYWRSRFSVYDQAFLYQNNFFFKLGLISFKVGTVLKIVVQTPYSLFSSFRNCFQKQFAKLFFNKKIIENGFLFLFLKIVLKNKNRNRFANELLLAI
jgi:hypothetical protein